MPSDAFGLLAVLGLVVDLVGQILAGKYRVERVLGQGGMGIVVQATHIHLGQRVAIKFVLPEVLHNPEIRSRFLREAQAAAQLRSAHVARVVDIGTLDTGSPFIVMEYLEGEDLASILQRHGPVPVATAAAWMLEVCEALAEAHALGIIHRDLKPGNLFLACGAGGLQSVKVFDFGISKVTTGAGLQQSLTQTISVLGSPMYASPEQLRATKNVDHRTDIWALGVTLYQLVSADMPWKADTIPELSIKVAIDPPPPLPPHLRVPGSFEQIIRRCLEKDPTRRYPNVAALAEALGAFVPDGRVAVDRVRRAGHVAGGTGTTLSSSAAQIGTTRTSRLSGRTYGIFGAVVLSAGVGALAMVLTRASGSTVKPVSGKDDTPVVAAPADAAPAQVIVPVATPDAAPPQVVAATPDAAVAAVSETPDARPQPIRTGESYRELVEDARRLGKISCASAVRLYERAIDLQPRAAEAFAGLGTCLLELKDYDRAISNFRAALAISRRNPEALIGAAEAYQYKGNSAAAISHYKQYLEVSPRGEGADRARRNLAKLAATPDGSKLTDDDLFGNPGSRPK